jgi:hypothetical protein
MVKTKQLAKRRGPLTRKDIYSGWGQYIILIVKDIKREKKQHTVELWGLS